MNKKTNNIVGIIVVVGIVLLVVGMIIFGATRENGNLGRYFEKENRLLSESLYKKILEISDESYPETPQQVVDLYLDGHRLLYSENIKDFTIVGTILEKQRELFSPKLLATINVPEQEQIVQNNIINIKEQKIRIIQTEVEEQEQEQEQSGNMAFIKAIIRDNLFQEYHYLFQLEKEIDDKWKIVSFENTKILNQQ